MAADRAPRPEELAELAELPTVAMPVPEHLLVSGHTVFGRYALHHEVGRGGMGVVWAAHDTDLEMDVALKFLPEAVARDVEAFRELRRETRFALALTHPHIVRVYTIVQELGIAAIVMELVAGQSLAQRKALAACGCLTVAELAPLVAQLCEALDYAHRRAKVAHRDLKPGNLLVDTQGGLKVSDFGIARRLNDTCTRLTMKAGMTSGTLRYMSPQQLLGQAATESDDVYALGATLYDLLTGRPPFFRGDLPTQIQQAVPPPLTQRRAELGHTGPPIPPQWEAAICACLAKDPAQRPESAGVVAEMLSGDHPVADGPQPGELTGLLEAPTQRAVESATVCAVSTSRLRKRRSSAWPWILVSAGAVACALVLATFRDTSVPPPAVPWLSGLRERADTIWATVWPNRTVEEGATKPMLPALPVFSAPEVVVNVMPVGVAARVWIGPAADIPVPLDGRLAVSGLPDGEHELIVQAPGYQPFTKRVSVVDGRGRVEAKLVAVRGTLIVEAQPGTAVFATDSAGRTVKVGTVGWNGVLSSEDQLVVGRHDLRFEHPDFVSGEPTSIELIVGRPARVAPVQVSPPAELRVFSVPTGAEVWVAGQEVGVTPATVRDLPSEQPVTVEVRRPGYRTARREVTLRPKEVRTLNLGTLSPEAGGLELRLPAGLDPTRVRLLIDGHSVTGVVAPARGGELAGGVVPAAHVLRVDHVEIGSRRIEAHYPNYEPWIGEATIGDQQTTTVGVHLAPQPATLMIAVAGPPEFEVRVNGRAVERVAALRGGAGAGTVSASYSVPSGEELALEVVSKGYKPARHTVRLQPGRIETLGLALERFWGPESGEQWTVPALDLELIPISPGSFRMGSAAEGANDERPVTRVTLTRGFWLGKTEVTQAQWMAVMGTRVQQQRDNANPSWGLRGVGKNHPMYYVSWSEAMEFCARLTETERQAGRLPEGYIYTLPTEAQWEYACRAGATASHAGNINEFAWHNGNSLGQTHPVGEKRSNAWGLHDMLGSVWEWCSDGYTSRLPGGEVTDPMGAPDSQHRVVRGGSWVGAALDSRASIRGGRAPGDRGNALGFRLALSPVP